LPIYESPRGLSWALIISSFRCLKHATNHTQDRCTQAEKKYRIEKYVEQMWEKLGFRENPYDTKP
jgi:hypothetical protein